jgi:hypothetical protein
MKRLFLVIPCVLLASGCLKLEQTLSLQADGSATLRVEYEIPEQTCVQVAALLKLADELAEAQGRPPAAAGADYLPLVLGPVQEQLREYLRKTLPDDARVETCLVESGEGLRRVTVVVNAADLAALDRVPAFRDYGFKLSRLNSGNYRLARGPVTDPNAPAPAADDLSDPETVRLLTPVLGGFKATLSVETPSPILEANSNRRSLRRVDWEFDFNRNPADFRAFHTERLSVVFDGAGLSLPAGAPAR